MNIRRLSGAEQDEVAWATLAWEGGVGPAGFSRLLGRFGTAQAVLQASEEQLSAPSLRLQPGQIAAISAAAQKMRAVAQLIAALRADGVAVVCAWQEDYPPALRAAHNPPPVICMRGQIQPRDALGLAIVGTRQPTPEGAANARALACACARLGATIISGLALGIDSAAHRGALDAGGRTIAVLGSGIRRVYPQRNRRLAEQIARSGAVISEAPPEASPSAPRLMARNRLVAALARGVVAVEATGDGGTLQTLRDALALGRLIFACDWQADKPQATGTRTALGMGAEPILGPDAAQYLVAALRNYQAPGPVQAELL